MAARRHRRWRLRRSVGRFYLRLCLFLFGVWGLWSILHAETFRLRGVEVSGLVRLEAVEVQRAAGLERGLYIWQVWPPKVAERVGEHPRVAKVRVNLVWPDKVRIAMEERQAVAVLLQQGSEYLEVDAAGRVLALAKRPPQPVPTLITGVEGPRLRPGHQIQAGWGVRAVAAAAALGPEGRARISEVHVDPRGEVTLYTRQGVPVYLGVDTDYAVRARAFLAVAARLEDLNKAAYIDLRSANRPAVRLKGAPASVPETPKSVEDALDRAALP